MGCTNSKDKNHKKKEVKEPTQQNKLEENVKVEALDTNTAKVSHIEDPPVNSSEKEKNQDDLMWLKMEEPAVCSKCHQSSKLFSPFSKNNNLICNKCSDPIPENDEKGQKHDFLKANQSKENIDSKPKSANKETIDNVSKASQKIPNKQTSTRPNTGRRPEPPKQNSNASVRNKTPSRPVTGNKPNTANKSNSKLTPSKPKIEVNNKKSPAQKPRNGMNRINVPKSGINKSQIDAKTQEERKIEPKNKKPNEANNQLKEMGNILQDILKKNEDMQVALSVVIDRTNLAGKTQASGKVQV